MTKLELEKELTKKTNELANFKEKVVEQLKSIMDNTCSESREHVDSFCEALEIPLIRSKILIEVPYGTEITTIEDAEYESIDYEIIETDVK